MITCKCHKNVIILNKNKDTAYLKKRGCNKNVRLISEEEYLDYCSRNKVNPDPKYLVKDENEDQYPSYDEIKPKNEQKIVMP